MNEQEELAAWREVGEVLVRHYMSREKLSERPRWHWIASSTTESCARRADEIFRSNGRWLGLLPDDSAALAPSAAREEPNRG